jgi:[glutamine synthetase] adenylyltransferase / [glutamine synthetase]-adenylyl-L-tyrosine phosphorylase
VIGVFLCRIQNFLWSRGGLVDVVDSQSVIRNSFSALPADIEPSVSAAWSDFCEQSAALGLTVPAESSLLESLGVVWASSRFVMESCLRDPSLLSSLNDSGDLYSDLVRSEYGPRLKQSAWHDEETLMRALRRFRAREMVRIAWRDIAGWADLGETLSDLSALAEVCLQVALDDLFERMCERQGTPLLSDGRPQQPVILGMGKLGAWELNFSSDIDLIFAYPEEGVLPGRRNMSYGEFFTKLCRTLVKVIDTATEDGFVFRVDLRLRPFGDSGPLIMSFDAMESYYQSQAREWERYAMIKARPVAGDPVAGEQLQAMLHPFVYRRYLDYRAFGELRQLKFQITQELQRKDRLNNIKLGPGGIREIEFVAQAFQLIRGGRNRALQERRVLKVLEILGRDSLLPLPVVEKLIDAYHILRRVENRLQETADCQVHDLPEQPDQRIRLAFSLGYKDWDAFAHALNRIRDQVQHVFEQVFESPQAESGHGDSELLWAGGAADDQLQAAAASLGYRQPTQVLQILSDFRKAHPIKKLTAQGSQYLDTLMPMLLGAAGTSEDPETALKRILGLIEAIAGRTVYLSLLVENPLALSQLVKLATASSWIVAHIARFPLLLDELLDPRTLYAPLSKEALKTELEKDLAAVDDDDLEQHMIELRHFKQAQVLRVAAADIMGVVPIMVVSDYLTDIAEVILDQVLMLAWGQLSKKHGIPPGERPNGVSEFGIIAYGKMGGIELGYGSDLDLVFLFGGENVDAQTDGGRPIGCAQFYARLGQRIIHILTANMLSGVLYEVDMRLRPSGNAGLLVSHIEAFGRYQHNDAWTWEHQALVRARFVAGAVGIGDKFGKIREQILTMPRDLCVLRKDVTTMREKMRASLVKNEPGMFDLKQGPGGIADIEFIVQYGVLRCAVEHPELIQFTGTVQLLELLRDAGFMSAEEADVLKDAYCLYRDKGHRAALQDKSALVPDDSVQLLRSHVQQIWQKLMLE